MNSINSTLVDSQDIPHSYQGPAPVHVVVGFGFWLFILSDIIIFSVLFATYAVLSDETAGGPSGIDLFNKNHVLLETICLLFSSFTCGLGSIAVQRRKILQTYVWMAITIVLGASFIWLELTEFFAMIAEGAGPSRSAFLSAFFTLVGTHGLHVTIGLIWLVIMLLQIKTLGFKPMVVRRMFCFSLFWHALDIVWIAVFTIVYLGAH